MLGSPFNPQMKKLKSENTNMTPDKIAQLEYMNKIKELEEKIKYLKSDLRDEQVEKWSLEEKLAKLENNQQIIIPVVKKEEINKIEELEILLRECRKQNIKYHEELMELRKYKLNNEKTVTDLEYYKDENRTLKSFIVAQNASSHYKRAFDDNDEYHIDSNRTNGNHDKYNPANSPELDGIYCNYSANKEEDTDPVSNKINNTLCHKAHNNRPYFITPDKEDDDNKEITNNGEINKDNQQKNDEYSSKMQLLSTIQSIDENVSPVSKKEKNGGKNKKDNLKSNKENTKQQFPKINKTVIRKISDCCKISYDIVDELCQAIFHIGDQIIINVNWDKLDQVSATIKYIGNLGDRYLKRLYLGVKLHTTYSQIPTEQHNNGCFRNNRYFTINQQVGYFLHISHVNQVFNKQTRLYEDFVDYFHRTIDPQFNRKTKI